MPARKGRATNSGRITVGLDAVRAGIKLAQNHALRVLKPAQRDLQYGLELHREIAVVDSFGFAPFCAVDPGVLDRAVGEGASAAERSELWNEMRVTRCVYDKNEREEFQFVWRAAGITALFQNAGGCGLPETFAHYCLVIDRMPDFFVRATTPDEVLAAKKAGKHAMLFSSNIVPLAGDGSSIPGELRLLRAFFSAGFRQAHLTYNRANQLADGCAESRNGGLTDLGRAAVAAMNDAGIMVDVAHTGWRSSYEAAKASRLPIIASHTACCGVFEHCRGKPDEAIKAIAAGGGIIGVVWLPAFLGKHADMNTMLDHVDYLAKLVGTDHIAMGTDAIYRTCRCEAESRKAPVNPVPKSRPALETFWPAGMATNAPEWDMARADSLAWVNRPYATVGLKQRGYSDDDIARITGGNHLRVLQANLDGRKIPGFPGPASKNPAGSAARNGKK